jgi:uncharacterized membrane protein
MSTERLVSRVLMVGGILSVTAMVIGLVGLEGHALRTGATVDVPRVVENRAAGHAVDVFVSVPAAARALARWPPDPVAGIAVGLLGLLLTPAVGVLAALSRFAAARDRQYVVICLVLIAALACGLFMPGAH